MSFRPWRIAAIITVAVYAFCGAGAWSFRRYLANAMQGSEEAKSLPSAWEFLTSRERVILLGWGTEIPGIWLLWFSWSKLLWSWQWVWLALLFGITWRSTHQRPLKPAQATTPSAIERSTE